MPNYPKEKLFPFIFSHYLLGPQNKPTLSTPFHRKRTRMFHEGLFSKSQILFKMKFKRWPNLLLLLLLLTVAEMAQSSQQGKQIPTSKVGDVIKGINYKVDQYRSFQLIFVPNLQRKYLFFSLTADQIYAHVELNLTLYKQGAQIPLKHCIKQEVDACYIPREQLTPNETVFVVVDSGNEEMEYELRTYWSDLEHISVGSEVRFMFSKTDKRQIYHLELEGQEFKELRIVIKPETRRFAFDKIKMYGTYGKDSLPSADKHDFKSVYLWEDAEGIYLYRHEIKDLSMNLILQGESETVYSMRCDLVNEIHHDLKLNTKIYEYLQKGEDYVYHVTFTSENGKLEYENYVLTIAGFTGDLNLEFYSDKELTKRLQSKEPYMYMGDVQYPLTKKQIELEMKDGIYIKAASKGKISTFMMEIQGRSKSEIFEIHEHIYEFIPVEKQAVSYFKIGRFNEGVGSKFDLKVVLSIIQADGRSGLQFRKCTSTLDKCLGEVFRANSQKINSQYRVLGKKETYTIKLQQDFWKNVNQVQQNAIVLVVLTNQAQNGTSIAAVQYNVGNRPEFLRESKPIQSHVLKNEMKVYKFTTADTGIEKVRLHINKISGCFTTYVFRHEPTQQELTKDVNKVSGALYEQTSRLVDDPIVVVIKGQDSATYSLTLQAVHKTENEIAYITLSEDVEFKIKIAPNKYEIFEIVPISPNIFYKYKSTGALHACVLKDNVCMDKEPHFSNEGSIDRPNFSDRSLYIKLRNPSSTKSIEVTSIFHSKEENHCQQKKIGHLYKEIVKEGSCFATTVDTAQDFQVFIVRQEVGHLSYTMALCDKVLNFAIKQNGQERYIITKEQILLNCQGHSDYKFFFVAASGKEFNKALPLNIHLKYLVQYTASNVILPDGIGYHGSDVTTEQPLKKFVFPLLNKIDTSIILSTQYKLYFLVKFIQAGTASQTVVSINSYDLSSPSEKFYFLQSIYLKISEVQMQKYTCRECELLIYVFSKEKMGTAVDYTMEVTQNFVKLQEGVPKSGYLIQNSKAYYGYNIKNSGSLLVEVSDNNENCAQLYLSSLQYPDENRHMEKSFDGQVILEVTESLKNYYITVRARKTCAYTLTAALTQGKNHVVKLQRGILGYCNLAQNEVKLYTFKHLSDQSFKIISLHKYGHVQFYLNRTTPDEILGVMKKEKVDLDSFTFHSGFKNRLILDKTKPEFCKDCYYLLAVQAKKHTESSIFLGDQSTKIPLSESKVINDILPKSGMSTRGQFSYFAKGVLEVKVHSGKLQVEILFKDQSLKKTFEKSKALINYNFSLNADQYTYGAATVIYTALQDNTLYSSRVKSAQTIEETKEGHQYMLINSNAPNYLYLNKAELTCMKGFLKRADERLFISFYSQDKQTAQKLKIVGKLGDNYTQISQDTTRNVISITFIDALKEKFTQALPYELCLSHDTESLSLTILQSEETGLLPQNLEVLVVNKQIYDIYPQGNFLLDIFECRGTTKISYGINKKQLQKNKPKVLDMIGMPDQPHAVRLQEGYSNLLLSVQGQLSLIRWIQINEQQQRGLGYYVYNAGNTRYNSGFGEIQFLVDPIKRVKKTKTKIDSVRYNLYISNNEQDLKQASLCEKYLPGSVIEYKVIYSQLTNSTFKFAIHKTNLMEKYKEAENLYFNIVADLTIKTPGDTSEEYRFIYKSQELPAQVFLPNQLEKYDVTTLIIALVLFILAILILTWVFAKVIVPLIGRLRNSVLVQENGLESSKDRKDGEKEEGMEPPPSSDRQGIVNNDLVVPQTEHKM